MVCGGRRLRVPGVVATVGEHARKSGEALAVLVQQKGCTVAVLHDGGVRYQPDRQAQDVHQGVDLASLHLLSLVMAHGIGRVGGGDLPFATCAAAPFSADPIVWFSIATAVG